MHKGHLPVSSNVALQLFYSLQMRCQGSAASFYKNQTVLFLLTILHLEEEISCLDNVWGLAVYWTTTVNK